MTAPMTLRRPPMNSMISSDSSAVGSTSVSGTNSWVPAYTAPPSAANTQPSTNSSSLRRGVRTPMRGGGPLVDAQHEQLEADVGGAGCGPR